MKSRALALPLLALATAAAAQPLPTGYDPRAYCVALGARTGARSAGELDECLAEEAQARRNLEAKWERASSAIRERCLLRNARHSYDLLDLCVEAEMERAR